MAKKTVEAMYPDKKARTLADAVTDAMSLEETMLSYLIAWEEAYLAAGGRICL